MQMVGIIYKRSIGVADNRQQLSKVCMQLGVFFQVCQWWYVHDDVCCMMVATLR
jgi:hypothetical protein